MTDYIFRRAITLDDRGKRLPAGDAIAELEALNRTLEQAQPRHQPVPEHNPSVEAANGAGTATGNR